MKTTEANKGDFKGVAGPSGYLVPDVGLASGTGQSTAGTGLFREVGLAAMQVEERESWIHILEAGEYPSDITAGDEVIAGKIVIGAEELAAVAASYHTERPLLVDYEHFSTFADKSSEAAGWGRELRYTADGRGLELRVEWTASAAQKIRERAYQYISPVLHGTVKERDGVWHLVAHGLGSAGLTNTPNMRTLRAVSLNREIGVKSMKYKNQLCKILGLPETVEDSALDDAVAKFSAEREAENKRVTELEAELKELKSGQEAADVEKYKDVADAEAVKEFTSANRAAAIRHFEGLLTVKTKAGAPLYVAKDATVPEKDFNGGGSAAAEEAEAKFRGVQAHATERAKKEGISFATAFSEEKAKANL